MSITKLFSRKIFSSFLVLAAAGLLGVPGSAQEIDIGRIEVEGGARGVIPVFIHSEQAELRQAAERAFNVHGGYRLVRERSGASFIFTFRSTGGTSVSLDIASGNPPRSQFQQTVSGTSPLNALYRAADLAVTKTSGQPGFFAGQLVFVSDRTGAKEVYLSDLFQTEVRQLTRDGSDSVVPRWSPDGRKIVYTSYYRSGFPDIFQINLANQRREEFVSVRGTNTGARFSPDGSRVAMILSGEGHPELYVANSSGRQIRRLTRTNAVQSSPSWSPDGSRIVFYVRPGWPSSAFHYSRQWRHHDPGSDEHQRKLHRAGLESALSESDRLHRRRESAFCDSGV